jgi:HlyD family secretion protein
MKYYQKLCLLICVSFTFGGSPFASAQDTPSTDQEKASATDSNPQPTVEVATELPTAAEPKTVRVPATVSGIKTAEIYSKIGGFVKSFNVDIGDPFSAGDVLAQLEVPEIKTDVAQKSALHKQSLAEAKQAAAALKQTEARLEGFLAAITEASAMQNAKQANLEFQQLDYQRLSQMAASSAIRRDIADASKLKLAAAESEYQTVAARVAAAEANLVGAEAGVEKAKADVAAAKSRIAVAAANLKHAQQVLKYATIVAPWDGIVLDRNVDEGAFVQNADGNSAAQPMLRIAKVDHVRVTFSVSAADTADLDIGDRAVLSGLAAFPKREFAGKVTRFSGGLDRQTRMLKVEVELENKDGELKPGFFGYMTVYLSE